METNKNYLFQAFLILVLATALFLGFKKYLPKKIFSEKTGSSKNVVVDSMLIEAFEAEKVIAPDVNNEDVKIIDQNLVVNGMVFPQETFENYKGYQHLVSFFEKLHRLEKQENEDVRIAYFGDSMTDGDMIVEDIRNIFQNKYGGTGVGFVPITSESAASRSSIEHQFSPNWKTLSFITAKNPWLSFGLTGSVSCITDTINIPWVKYKASKKNNLDKLENATLFYGKSNNHEAKIKYITTSDTITKQLEPYKKLNTFLVSKTPLHSLKVNFIQSDSIPIYGFNFDSRNGIHVDNFSQRGNSGMPLTKLNIELMQEFNKILDYDLIILHYGTNVLNYGTKNYNWYERNMTKTVEHLKKCFPGVTVLIISTADKGTKYETEMRSDSAVIPLTKAQKRYAVSTQSGFINLFTLMGGDGSIVKWTEEEPAMANKDYTHFNYRGSKKVAQLLYQEINEGYELYKKLKRQQIIVPPKKTEKIVVDSIQSGN